MSQAGHDRQMAIPSKVKPAGKYATAKAEGKGGRITEAVLAQISLASSVCFGVSTPLAGTKQIGKYAYLSRTTAPTRGLPAALPLPLSLDAPFSPSGGQAAAGHARHFRQRPTAFVRQERKDRASLHKRWRLCLAPKDKREELRVQRPNW